MSKLSFLPLLLVLSAIASARPNKPTGPAAVTTATATIAYRMCGGLVSTPTPCPDNYTCMDDPRVDGCGMACDMPGICVPNDAASCGGIVGKQCDQCTGLQCYDYPGDSCDPSNRGFDCIGICL
ncbi:hypothetical protein BKA67DRAFT_396363 [Truncatella angustata]|uniref:Uncharacterized protein n=1 Tax=Truncatella angustata TaxID=152316 RepID=A0A9P8RKG3_9PEZI|nr:uncharacterized protein BKA67DRAFT_396363 [Truncatella angustata]KAH6647705.1 hypothetical protein BKA67DRAFT_396363 [Truncatella angustata]